MNCLRYPGTRWLIARNRLSTLKITTVKTFYDIIKEWGLEDVVDYHIFNNNIQFKNGSEVILMDLFNYPADPDFERLGSLELTGALIDEAAEIDERAYDILKSRLRYKLNEYNLIGKLLIVSNPCKGWIYNHFYKAQKDNTLAPFRRFVQSLPNDNPHLPTSYIETLKSLPDLDRKRLYEGMWEFVKSDFDLFKINALYDMFNVTGEDGEYYITADIASTGQDKTVIITWKGWNILKIDMYSKINTNEIVQHIRTLSRNIGINMNNVIVDAIGVGVGVADNLRCRRFIASEKALNKEPFFNIKSQVYFKLAEKINNNEIGCVNDKVDDIVDELVAHKRFKGDQDGKYRITSKELVKREIGRSPDISDAMAMRMYFALKTRKKTQIF